MELGGFGAFGGAFLAQFSFPAGFIYALALVVIGCILQWREERARERKLKLEVWIDDKRITDEVERLRIIDETRKKLR